MLLSFDGLSRSCVKWMQKAGKGPGGKVSRCAKFQKGKKHPTCPPKKSSQKYGPTLRSQNYVRGSRGPGAAHKCPK